MILLNRSSKEAAQLKHLCSQLRSFARFTNEQSKPAVLHNKAIDIIEIKPTEADSSFLLVPGHATPNEAHSAYLWLLRHYPDLYRTIALAILKSPVAQISFQIADIPSSPIQNHASNHETVGVTKDIIAYFSGCFHQKKAREQ